MITRSNETPPASVALPENRTLPVQSQRVNQAFNPTMIEQRVRRLSRRRLFTFNTLGWSITDAVVGFFSVVFGYFASPVASQVATSETAVQLIPCAITFAVVLLPVAHIAGLHDPRRRSNFADLFVRCQMTVIIAIFALSLAWMMFSFLRVGRYVMIITTLACFAGTVSYTHLTLPTIYSV